jgi:hypothetical protein
LSSAPSEKLHFATRHPADGRALRYHFDEFILDWLPRVARRLTRYPCAQTAFEHVPADLVELFIEQALYVELLDAARQIFRSRFAASQGGRPFSVAVSRDLAGVLRESLPEGGVDILASRRLALRSQVAQWRRRLRDAVDSRARAVAPAAHPGSIAVELVEGADPSRKSDAFWMAAGAVNPAQVLFVLEPLNRALVNVEQNLAAVRKLGSRIVALDPRMTAGGQIPLWRARQHPAWSRDLERSLPRASDRAERWLRRALSVLASRAGYWHAFYADHGVLAVQQFTELSTETAAKRVAIDRVGGIEMGKMRSQFFEKASAGFHFQHEVAFVWHRNVEPYLRSGRTRTHVIVETGYVYDYLGTALAAEGAALRQRLTARPAVVASVFDNDPHLNGHFSPADLEAFYRVVLQLAARHPQLGLIVKSKKPRILANLPSIGAELARLAASGRCIVLHEPLSSVVPAALSSDLALGFPASTAGCEAALAGCKVLMYDPACAGNHPWISADGVVFQDTRLFERAATAAIAAAADTPRRMPREQLLELDPHLDGASPARASAFVRSFLEARMAGGDKAGSLTTALARSTDYAFRVRGTQHK